MHSLQTIIFANANAERKARAKALTYPIMNKPNASSPSVSLAAAASLSVIASPNVSPLKHQPTNPLHIVNNTNLIQLDVASRYTPVTTEKFAPIRTSDALDALTTHGWEIQTSKVAKCRDAGRAPFVKHAITLSHTGDARRSEYRAQILVINGNDGSSAFRLFAGLYRFICANGIVVGQTFEGISIRHVGSIDEIRQRIISGAESVRQSLPLIEEQAEWLRGYELSPAENLQFNTVAAHLRFPKLADQEKLANLSLQFDQIRRREDASQDLWTTFNRVQETAIRGGIPTGNGRRRTRGIGNIARNTNLNRELWDLALDTRNGRLNDRFEAVVNPPVIEADVALIS
jgi:hypothetical protein